MPGRKVVLTSGEYYHVFNRGVARQPVFTSQKEYSQALLTLTYYMFAMPQMKLSRYKTLSLADRDYILADQRKKHKVLVKIIAFVFMPNHIHLLLQQSAEGGIARFMSQFQNSYTRYFNTKHERIGPLFQGAFKGVHVETEEQLVHLSRYIHLNPVVSYVIHEKQLSTYPWSSFPDYIKGTSFFLTMDSVLGRFKTTDVYKLFVFNHMDYAKQLEEIKHLMFE